MEYARLNPYPTCPLFKEVSVGMKSVLEHMGEKSADAEMSGVKPGAMQTHVPPLSEMLRSSGMLCKATHLIATLD